MQHRAGAAVRLDRGRKPDLAGAALHLVGVVAGGVGQRRQRAAELDQIAVAVVPLLQKFEILDDLVDRHGCSRGETSPFDSRPKDGVASLAYAAYIG